MEMEEDRSAEHTSYFPHHYHNLCNIKPSLTKLKYTLKSNVSNAYNSVYTHNHHLYFTHMHGNFKETTAYHISIYTYIDIKVHVSDVYFDVSNILNHSL